MFGLCESIGEAAPPPERGVARAVLRVLAARGLVLSSSEQDRVLACEDTPTLERWLLCAATADPDCLAAALD